MPDPFAAYVAGADPFAAFVSADEPVPPDPRVVAEQDRLTTPGFLHQVAQSSVEHAKAISERALIGMAAGAILPKLPAAAQRVWGAITSPAASAAAGAYHRYKNGGIVGAVTEGGGAYAANKGLGSVLGRGAAPEAGPDVAAGMSQAGRAAQAPKTSVLDALMRGAKYDELAGLPDVQAAAARIGKASAPAPTPSATPSTLLDEVAARAKLSEPINWRTTDVTPIAKPGKGIHFGEESTPGLLKLLQDAQLAKNQPLVDKLLTAIRQRSHITGKVGEP